MSETEVQAPAEPVVLARGRYKLTEEPDGGLWAAATTNLCERCQECGCGDQIEPRYVPAVMARMLTADGGLLGKLKAVMGRGGSRADG